MSIQSEITRISGNVADALSAIADKGVTVPAGSTSDDLADLIAQITGGGGGTGAVIDRVVQLPGGGDHHIITGVDISGDTVTAAHLETGYTAHDAEGNAITGTLSPGGGGGLEYEEGTFIPANDIARPTISFSDAHTTRPYNVIIEDASGGTTNNSILFWTVVSWYDAFGAPAYSTTGSPIYGGLRWGYGSSNGYAANGGNINGITGSSIQALDYLVTPTAFYPYCNSSSLVFRAGRTYKWIAVWA